MRAGRSSRGCRSTSDPQTWTRGEFAADVRAFAAGLTARGVTAGDRVALVLPNCPELLVAWSAVASMGAVAVCLDPRATADDLGYVAGHSDPRAVIASGPAAATAGTAMPGADILDVTDLGEHRHTLRPFAAAPEPLGPVAHDAPASIQYTSGTTARPKAVVWTQANCLWGGQVGAAHQGLGPVRRQPVAPAAVPHQRTLLLVPLQPVVRRPGGPRPAVLGVPVLGRLGPVCGDVDLRGLVLRARAGDPGGAGATRLPGLGQQCDPRAVGDDRRRAGHRLVRDDRDGLPPDRRQPRPPGRRGHDGPAGAGVCGVGRRRGRPTRPSRRVRRAARPGRARRLAVRRVPRRRRRHGARPSPTTAGSGPGTGCAGRSPAR